MRVKPAILSTLLLLTGCHQSIYEEPMPEPIVADTYISLQIQMEGSSLRAQQADWPGIDIIEWIYLYAFDTDSDEPGTIIPIGIPEEQQSKSPIQVTRPWRTDVGRKQFYIVVNPSPDIIDALHSACETSRTAFDRAYRDTAYSFLETDDFRDLRTNYWGSERLALTKHFIDSLATVSTDPTQDNMTYMAKYGMVQPSKALTYLGSKKSETDFDMVSKIMMTGEPVTQEITAGVSASEAPRLNNVSFTVERTVAQAVVTERNPGFRVKGFSRPLLTPLLRYAIIHQEPTGYLLSKESTTSGRMLSPGHGATDINRYNPPTSSHTDYKLWIYVPWNTRSGANITLETPFEDFLFPSATHPYMGYGGDGYGECFLMGGTYLPESSQPESTYTWKNTSLVVIQISFDCSRPKIGFNTVFYQGKNGTFYPNYDSAFQANNPAGTPLPPNSSTPEEQVKLKDNVITYPGARAYYIVPVNPITGEVRRNHFYHLHVTEFNRMGYSGIPLPNSPVPCDPDDVQQLEPLELGSVTRSVESKEGNYHIYNISL